MRGKKGRNYISRQACFVNRFTLQGFNIWSNKLKVSSLKCHFKDDTKKIMGQIQYIHNQLQAINLQYCLFWSSL